MEEKGLKRRDFFKTAAVGIVIAGLDLTSSNAGAQAQTQAGRGGKKDVAWLQEKAQQHYFVQRFN